MIWEEPPAETKSIAGRGQANTKQYLLLLAGSPGEWAKYPTECTKANVYRLAKLYPSFEWRHQEIAENKFAVWARAVG